MPTVTYYRFAVDQSSNSSFNQAKIQTEYCSLHVQYIEIEWKWFDNVGEHMDIKSKYYSFLSLNRKHQMPVLQRGRSVCHRDNGEERKYPEKTGRHGMHVVEKHLKVNHIQNQNLIN
jgi:hypothetical protein